MMIGTGPRKRGRYRNRAARKVQPDFCTQWGVNRLGLFQNHEIEDTGKRANGERRLDNQDPANEG